MSIRSWRRRAVAPDPHPAPLVGDTVVAGFKPETAK